MLLKKIENRSKFKVSGRQKNDKAEINEMAKKMLRECLKKAKFGFFGKD